MEIRCETSLLAQLEARSRAAAPAEACGLLAGERNRLGWWLTEFIPMTNRSQQLGRFSIDPIDHLRVVQRVEAAGQQLCALFHSHPGGDLTLSASDLRCAWPELIQVICATRGRTSTKFAAWQVGQGRCRRLAFSDVLEATR